MPGRAIAAALRLAISAAAALSLLAFALTLTKLAPGNAGWKQQLAWFNGQIAQVAPAKP